MPVRRLKPEISRISIPYNINVRSKAAVKPA